MPPPRFPPELCLQFLWYLDYGPNSWDSHRLVPSHGTIPSSLAANPALKVTEDFEALSLPHECAPHGPRAQQCGHLLWI